jgi:hypothetical protein
MKIQMMVLAGRTYKPFEEHTAESQWQYCNCRSCQDYRHLIETAPPGTKFNFDTYRHKDEKYPPRGFAG